jgi:hypothetical protein
MLMGMLLSSSALAGRVDIRNISTISHLATEKIACGETNHRTMFASIPDWKGDTLSEILHRSDLKRILWEAIGPDGTQKKWAASNGFSATFVRAVINGRQTPSPRFLAALGLERVEAYKQKE